MSSTQQIILNLLQMFGRTLHIPVLNNETVQYKKESGIVFTQGG